LEGKGVAGQIEVPDGTRLQKESFREEEEEKTSWYCRICRSIKEKGTGEMAMISCLEIYRTGRTEG
jgi:hypothetical protein